MDRLLVVEDFEPHQGAQFTLRCGTQGPDLGLRLVQVQAGPAAVAGGRRAFSLLFEGPLQPALAQDSYAIEHPQMGWMELFIVPVARGAGGMEYEAIFN